MNEEAIKAVMDWAPPPDEVPLGKIIGEPNELYHTRDAVSNTRLKIFEKSPLLYKMRYIDKLIPASTSLAFEIGKAFHYRCEGMKVFKKNVAVNTRYEDFRTKEAQRWRDHHKKAGRAVINPEEHETIARMVFHFRRNPLAMELLRNTEREVTWRAKIGKFTVQCRTDRWSGEPRYIKCLKETVGPYFVDFKTVPSLSDGDFTTHVTNFDYHWQEAFYAQVIQYVLGVTEMKSLPRCFFVVTEKQAPYLTEVYEIDEETKQLARASIMRALFGLRKCYETDVWFDPQVKPKPVGLRYWKLKEEQKLLEDAQRQIS